MDTIVAATDYSAWAHYALERAAQLARGSGAELHVLHAPSRGRWPQGGGVLSQYFGGGNEPSIDDERERLAAEVAGPARRFRVKPQCHVLPGRPAEEIAAFANAREAGLVVVGSRGESGLRAQAVGSTALKVLWQSLTPVLMVRQPVDVAYRKVLVATDLSERSLHVVRTALDVFPKAAATLLHAWRGEFETTLELTGATADARRRYVAAEGEAAAAALEDQRMRALGGSRRRLARFIAHGHPLPAIQKAVAELQPDVVVLGKHSGPRWQEQVLGSVVQNLLQQLKIDVLVVA
jgi:nucleotide-binding universal stress UspA family protein